MKKLATLAERVKFLIDFNNLSVTAAAKKCGIPQPRLNDIVLGKTLNPQAKTIKRIAKGMDATEGWLITGEGEIRPAEKSERDYLDPELARVVMAEIKGRQGKEPIQLTARQASLLEMISDLPEEEQKRIEYEIMTAWIACRRNGK